MRARDQTARLLAWWRWAGVHSLDLAVRTAQGAWIFHRGLFTFDLPLGWLRAENARQSEIYARPARGASWPVVFLDDISVGVAEGILACTSAAAIHTSPEGGCHLWMRCARPLDEGHRRSVQRALAQRYGGDPGSISGEHLGRLPGFKNWKRGGVWVNVLATSLGEKPPLDLSGLLVELGSLRSHSTRLASPTGGADRSASGRDWAWACTAIESGRDPELVFRRLFDRAEPRRGADAERYARRTVARALWLRR